MSSTAADSSHRVASVVCPACCCLCDDIQLDVRAGRVAEVHNACPRGRDWFLAANAQPDASQSDAFSIDGNSAALDEAIDAAARVLCNARYPLVFMLPQMSSEAQRAAIAVADWAGAVIDTATGRGHAPSILGAQHAGKVTCTLGETRNRADFILFWGTNVVAKYPRFFTRYSAEAVGKFVPGGRADRTCVAIDVQENETTRAVDRAMLIRPDSDFVSLAVLRALVAGISLDAGEVHPQTGIALETWQALVDQMKLAQFGSIVFGKGLMYSRGRQVNCESLFRLVAELNAHTRFVCRSIRAAGNVTGGDKTMTWQTGYPFAVNFARGFPRFGPGEFTANELLKRREADAVLIVGGREDEWLEDAALAHLKSIPTIRIGRHDSPPTPTPSATQRSISIRTARHALESSGTMFRIDDVPIVARAALSSQLPTEEDVLTQLAKRIRE
jgi:formylmethanofuran dehydrogenase subunit B